MKLQYYLHDQLTLAVCGTAGSADLKSNQKNELRDGPEQPLNSSIDYYSFSIDLLIDYSMFCGLNESCNLIQILFTIAFVVDLWWLGSLDSEAPGT